MGIAQAYFTLRDLVKNRIEAVIIYGLLCLKLDKLLCINLDRIDYTVTHIPVDAFWSCRQRNHCRITPFNRSHDFVFCGLMECGIAFWFLIFNALKD